MKLTISSQELNYLLNKLGALIPLKPATPVLQNLLIEATSAGLCLSATDLNITIRCTAEADASSLRVHKEGSLALPGKKFIQLAKELTAPSVEITETSPFGAVIVSGSSRFRLHGIDPDLYPAIAVPQEAATFTLPQTILKEMLYRTTFSVSREENRQAITGVFMQVTPERVTLTGTDGKRLAKTSYTPSTPFSFTGHVIIPLRATEEILKNLQDREDPVQITLLAEEKIAVEANHTLVLAKLLQGEYPDTDRIIPEKCSHTVTLHREELMGLLRQVTLFTTEQHYSVRCLFQVGELQLAIQTKEVGEGKAAMPVNFSGEPIEIAFNPTFFLDILRHCKQEVVTLGLTDRHNPGKLFDGEGKEEGQPLESLFILMPMRLEN